MRDLLVLAMTVALAGCGGADAETERSTAGKPSGGAQIAGPVGSGGPRIAGGPSTLDEALHRLARHAADLLTIMRDHMHDCSRAARVCDAYLEHNRESIENAKERIATAIEAWPPDRNPEEQIERDLQQLLLEMEPDTKQIAEDFEDHCREVADEVGDALEF